MSLRYLQGCLALCWTVLLLLLLLLLLQLLVVVVMLAVEEEGKEAVGVAITPTEEKFQARERSGC